MKLSKENFRVEQLTKSGSKWAVWFIFNDRGVTGVSVYFDNIKAPNKDRAINKVMTALKQLEIL